MLTLIVGSTAAQYRWRDWPRKPKDIDCFAQNASWLIEDRKGDVFWDERLHQWFGWRDWGGCCFATRDELYTVKVSHAYWELKNGTWDKHITDIIWMQNHGCKLDQELHDLLYKVWEDKHGRKKVNLQMESDDFFNDAVHRVYDHDSIHASVAYGERALYEDVLKDGSTVDVDMARIRALPLEDRIKLYREEVAATALERIVIPSGYRGSPGKAWKWALRRTITSLTKGWSAQFLVENIQHFIRPDDYVRRHLSNTHKLIPLEK